MAATAASNAGSSSPRTSFVADSLVLPTRNGSLFASAFALVYAHTFVSFSVALLYAHPLAAAVLVHVGVLARENDIYDFYPAESDEEIRGHAKKLLLLYLAYLASQLATRVAVALAASATCAGDRRPRSLTELVAAGRTRATLATAALVAVLQFASSAAVLAACLASWCWWKRGAAARSDTAAAVASFVSGYVLFLLLLVLLSHIFLAAVFQVAIAASAADEGYGEGGTRAALRRAWRLMAARAMRKEAAVMVLVASLLPVAIYPAYAFAVYCLQSGVFGVFHGYLLPSAGVQLYSTVAAAVFYHRCTEHHYYESVMPLAMKQAR
ncbi:hypothetical protein CFC21_043703 [Triticum aestivum]|uniref:Uncharacterized protein n=2 Tax=Triticum aestivum TaxID=4565 RepID=A0A9R1JWT7_WHEAT|nr:uncharacterized protein LOC119278277 [Triticum dicoccoides]XP_044351616.1 uncharacterized protein LOC123072124 [Triticum aestivum]KAF7032544.1 hypothetical protein CFC21_043703 [Triticum aestivum]CDM85893.1 unnamed protein product [Triticum aestivum]